MLVFAFVDLISIDIIRIVLVSQPQGNGNSNHWVAVRELELSYHYPKTILFTTDQYYGTFI